MLVVQSKISDITTIVKNLDKDIYEENTIEVDEFLSDTHTISITVDRTTEIGYGTFGTIYHLTKLDIVDEKIITFNDIPIPVDDRFRKVYSRSIPILKTMIDERNKPSHTLKSCWNILRMES